MIISFVYVQNVKLKFYYNFWSKRILLICMQDVLIIEIVNWDFGWHSGLPKELPIFNQIVKPWFMVQIGVAKKSYLPTNRKHLNLSICVKNPSRLSRTVLIIVYSGRVLSPYMCPEIAINLLSPWSINFSNDSIVFCLLNAVYTSK